MKKNRIDRINSLLREVISDVILKQVKNPHVNLFVSVTRVDTSADLYHAKVYISLIGTDTEKQNVLHALESAAGFIAVQSSHQVKMRHFPSLSFKLDNAAEEHFKIEKLLFDIEKERQSRAPTEE
ncbi:MAG TPA: 30S ribosome-binding factor RbfA [Chlamydiales bacterium]|nr:30S ribosome-binding factor RbfA [Chlamydiales bacterium]